MGTMLMPMIVVMMTMTMTMKTATSPMAMTVTSVSIAKEHARQSELVVMTVSMIQHALGLQLSDTPAEGPEALDSVLQLLGLIIVLTHDRVPLASLQVQHLGSRLAIQVGGVGHRRQHKGPQSGVLGGCGWTGALARQWEPILCADLLATNKVEGHNPSLQHGQCL